MIKCKWILLVPVSLICMQNFVTCTCINYGVSSSLLLSTQSVRKVQKQTCGRGVTKFKSTPMISANKWFHRLKQKFANSNIDSSVKNTSKFNMNIKYSSFNSFGMKINHVKKSLNNNLEQPLLNIGVSLLSQISVQVPKQSSKWGKYVADPFVSANPTKISESSVTYALIATGTVKNENVKFVMSYALRNAKPTDKKTVVQLGHFDVYNKKVINKHGLSEKAKDIIISVAAVLILALVAAAVGGGSTLYFKRASFRKFLVRKGLLRTRIYSISDDISDDIVVDGTKGDGANVGESAELNSPTPANSSSVLPDDPKMTISTGTPEADGNLKSSNKAPNEDRLNNTDLLGTNHLSMQNDPSLLPIEKPHFEITSGAKIVDEINGKIREIPPNHDLGTDTISMRRKSGFKFGRFSDDEKILQKLRDDKITTSVKSDQIKREARMEKSQKGFWATTKIGKAEMNESLDQHFDEISKNGQSDIEQAETELELRKIEFEQQKVDINTKHQEIKNEALAIANSSEYRKLCGIDATKRLIASSDSLTIPNFIAEMKATTEESVADLTYQEDVLDKMKVQMKSHQQSMNLLDLSRLVVENDNRIAEANASIAEFDGLINRASQYTTDLTDEIYTLESKISVYKEDYSYLA